MSDIQEAQTGSEQIDARANAGNARRSKPLWRRIMRPFLLLLGPVVVLVVAAYVYMNTGRLVETDNAYVKATTTMISPEVAGQIAQVPVQENEPVQAGDVLFSIDDRAYRVAVDRAKSQLEAVEAFLKGLEASYKSGLAQLELAHMNVDYAERQLEREQSLSDDGLGSDVDLDRARHDLDVAEQQVPIVEQQLAQIRAQLGGDVGRSPHDHAAYRTVMSLLDIANLDLYHTVVRAPFDGVASRVPFVGGYVSPGEPVMSVVSSTEVWIDANYKETQLTHVEVGQPVEIRVDTYPGREWRGHVESISQATGAEFSVIPPQNASGNWVKVAQRIPVRIALDMRAGDPPLRAGMSAIIDIDTGHKREAPPYLGFLRVFQRSSGDL